MNTQQFPEIAKAVQRGGKYLKRVPKPGGGYRYVYKEKEDQKAGVRQMEKEIDAIRTSKKFEAAQAKERLAEKYLKRGRNEAAIDKMQDAASDRKDIEDKV
jgi:hypothetical protein